MVVGTERYIVGQLKRARQLIDRTGDFLELGVGYGLRFHHVDRRHATGNAVGPEEQALAPDQAMATGAHGRGVIGQLAVPVHERIEQFTVAAMQVAGVVGKFVVGHGTGVGPSRVVVIVVVLV
ncbi:hypothetical protein D3C87_1698590 [compost metagenome]